MSKLFIDIETIPDQAPGAFEAYRESISKNFKAPSTLSKAQACIDLGVDATTSPWKFKTKDECLAAWAEHFAATKSEEVAEQEWRKTALDGSKGEIVSIAYSIDGQTVDGMIRELGQPETDLLKSFFDSCQKATMRHDGLTTSPYMIGHNVPFDIGFLFKRCVIKQLKPAFRIPHGGRHHSDFFCTMQAWAGFNGRISQDSLCDALGLPLKPDGISGANVWDEIKAENYQGVLDYNKSDVRSVIAIYNRLTFSSLVESA
jgi:hypothetical protein